MNAHTSESLDEKRFEFGKNWRRFLRELDDRRIKSAETSLKDVLGVDALVGKKFLDIGSGSGLFSLAARRLGAYVHSIDIDVECVACTEELKARYFSGDEGWTVKQGSVLDDAYIESLGHFDIVYSWGVLHHTGAMWRALGNAILAVAPGGLLFISIYNDQGRVSQYWRIVKRTYNRLPRGLRFLLLWPVFARLRGPAMVRDLLQGKPFDTWRNYADRRGMSSWPNLVDWVGGYPFEVAKPEEILDFCRYRNFVLVKLKTCGGGRGCNEFVFERAS